MHVVATAGHVDHGKSTLVRALTGMEPDRWAEERRRGMTLDLGFAWTELPAGPDRPARLIAFVDVPGHERFVSTMLAGVGPVPAVLLVVAADEGWMPQTAEHVDACLALGVRDGLLVISRCDLLDPEPARDDTLAQLADTPLAGLPVVAVSAVTGQGMDRLRAELAALAGRLPTPDPAADVRFWVDRAFTIRGAGTVVTGTLGGGQIRVDDELELVGAAGERRVTVRGVQCLGAPVAAARGTARVALNLRGVARAAVARGDVLCTPRAWSVTDLIDVRLHGTRRPAPAAGALPTELTLHIGAAAVPVRVRPLGPDTARLRLARPLPLRIGDRAVLRDPGRREVAAGATALDVAPPPLRRRGAAARRAAELAGMSAVPDAAAELARRGVARRADLVAMGVPGAELDALVDAGAPSAGGWLVAAGRVGPLVERLRAAVAAHDAADPLDPGLPLEAARRAVDLPDARLLDALLRPPPDAVPAGPAHAHPADPAHAHPADPAHAHPADPAHAHPADPAHAHPADRTHAHPADRTHGHPASPAHGRPAEPARGRRPGPGLELRDGRVVQPTAGALPAPLRAALDVLRAELAAHPFAAPEAGRLAELGLGPRQQAALVRAGELLRLADGVLLLPGADDRALDVLAGLEPAFTLSAARQALGTSRRVAVPLLELLARTGRTARTPDGGHRLR